MRPAVEIRGLDALRKRFAALGALNGLGPALRAEAEVVADAARERLRERDPQSQLAQSIKIMELEAGDQPAFAVGTDDPAGFFLDSARPGGAHLPGLSQFCTRVYPLLTMRSERLSRRL